MKTRILIYITICLVASLACKAQDSTSFLHRNDSGILYETIKDSAFCSPPFREWEDASWYIHYELPYFKVKIPIEETQPYSFFIKDSLVNQLRATMQDLEKECSEDRIPGGHMFFKVTYNSKNLLSFIVYHEDINGWPYPYEYNYDFNHKIARYYYNYSTYLNIFKKEKMPDLALKINQLIESEVRYFAENDPSEHYLGYVVTKEDAEQIIERLSKHTIEEFPYRWVLMKDEDYGNKEGILFLRIGVPKILAETRYNTKDFFFTFEELQPYLTESFKEQVGLK